MSDVRGKAEIDRLIEDGLSLYGKGDLDGALLAWEQALSEDPDNEQANSYVDYVRMHYELLTGGEADPHADADGGYGIGADEDPEYQIEIVPGQISPVAPPPMYMDPLDEGWFIEGDNAKAASAGAPVSAPEVPEVPDAPEARDAPALHEPARAATEADAPRADMTGVISGELVIREISMEAEEPDEDGPSFDDATSEYPINRRGVVTGDFQVQAARAQTMADEPAVSVDPDVANEAPELAFGTQVTDIKRRDLGFVQPAAAPVRNRRGSAPPELKMTLRTPTGGMKPLDKAPEPPVAATLPSAGVAGRLAPEPLAWGADGTIDEGRAYHDAEGAATTHVAPASGRAASEDDGIAAPPPAPLTIKVSTPKSAPAVAASATPEPTPDAQPEAKPEAKPPEAKPEPTPAVRPTVPRVPTPLPVMTPQLAAVLADVMAGVDDAVAAPKPAPVTVPVPVPVPVSVSVSDSVPDSVSDSDSVSVSDSAPIAARAPSIELAIAAAEPVLPDEHAHLARPDADDHARATAPIDDAEDAGEAVESYQIEASEPAQPAEAPPLPPADGVPHDPDSELSHELPSMPTPTIDLTSYGFGGDTVSTPSAMVAAALESRTTLPFDHAPMAAPSITSQLPLPPPEDSADIELTAAGEGTLGISSLSGPTRELSRADLSAAASYAELGNFELGAAGAEPIVTAATAAETRELERVPTSRLPVADADRGHAPVADDPMISAPTRELGLRPPQPSRTTSDEEITGTRQPIAPSHGIDHQAGEGTRHDVVLPFDPIDARSTQILEEVDDAAPAGEPREDKTRRRITTLLDRAAEWNRQGDHERAVAAVDLALSEDPSSALAQKLIHRNRDAIMAAFQHYLGDLERVPALARPLHELGSAPISPRAAFLLSRIDGTLTLDEILDVSGMPRLEAFRYLCQLFLRGILR
jgi:hypothetical protein